MNGYTNPQAITFDGLYGIDAAIQDVQLAMKNSPGKFLYLDIIYGRAFKQQKIVDTAAGAKRTVYFPQCYGIGMEPINVMPNDNIKGQCFFYIKDPGRPVNYTQFEYNNYIYDCSAIFWINGRKLWGQELPKDRQYLVSGFIHETLGVFKNLPQISEVTAIYESFENVYSEYTLTDEYRQYNNLPYMAYRIDFKIGFLQEC